MAYGGGGWTGLQPGRAWAGLLPGRETAYVALANAPRLAGSTFAWVGRRTGWTAALGCPCCSPDPRGGWVSLGLGARGPHRHSGGMTTLRVWVVRPLERPRTPRAPGPQSALTARAAMGLRGHEGLTWDNGRPSGLTVLRSGDPGEAPEGQNQQDAEVVGGLLVITRTPSANQRPKLTAAVRRRRGGRL